MSRGLSETPVLTEVIGGLAAHATMQSGEHWLPLEDVSVFQGKWSVQATPSAAFIAGAANFGFGWFSEYFQKSPGQIEEQFASVHKALRAIRRTQKKQIAFIVPMTTLTGTTTDLRLKRDIPVVLQRDDGAFVASFFDANINASGEDALDAFESLKEEIASRFLFFCEHQSELGDEPKRQLAVLSEFVKMAEKNGQSNHK